MKKIFSFLFIIGALSIISCGPSAEQKAKDEAAKKAKMDSLFNAASKSVSAAMDTVTTAKPKVGEGVK